MHLLEGRMKHKRAPQLVEAQLDNCLDLVGAASSVASSPGLREDALETARDAVRRMRAMTDILEQWCDAIYLYLVFRK